MKRLTGPGVVPTGEMVLPMIWNRLKDIENILGDDYDLQRLEQLLGGDNFTQEDMSAAYTSGFEMAMKENEKTGGWIDAEHEVPPDSDHDVLCVITGDYGNLHFEQGVLLGSYSKSEGWIVDLFPEWENVPVTHWRPIPEVPHA